MKVRDLEAYRNILTEGKEIREIGAGNDFLYHELVGRGVVFDKYIEQISDFAVNSAHEQIFYEFLQNACDAKADYFFIAFDAGHLLVANNAEPFYTDGQIEMPGRLRTFLSKGRTGKVDDESIGEKGRGSKLLYNLMLPENTNLSVKEGLLQTIKEERKGPILFSWKNQNGSTPLLDLKKGLDDNLVPVGIGLENPLLTKLLYTYYPAALGESKQIAGIGEKILFSSEEYEQFTAYLRVAFRKHEANTAAFAQGSILYIPLGEGKSEKLQTAFAEQLADEIAKSLLVIPNVKIININGERTRLPDNFVRQHLILDLPYKKDKKKTAEIFYPKKIADFEGDIVNFSNYFPITNEKHGLKFIIHSKHFDTDSGRQNISKESNRILLQSISDALLELLKALREENRFEYIHFIKILLLTDEAEIERSPMIKELFYDRLIEYMRENIPVLKNDFSSSENVYIKKSALNFLKLTGKFWLPQEFDDFQDAFKKKLNLPVYHTSEFVSRVEFKAISGWIKRMSDSEYQTLLKELNEENHSDFIKFKIFKNDAGDFTSLKKLNESERFIPIDERIECIKKNLENYLSDLYDVKLLGYSSLLHRYNKLRISDYSLLKRILSELENQKVLRDDKWAFMECFAENLKIDKQSLRRAVNLFKINGGAKWSIINVIHPKSELAKFKLLNVINLNSSENYFDKFQDLFMQTDEVWAWLTKHWERYSKDFTPNLTNAEIAKDLNGLYDISPNPETDWKNTVNWINSGEDELISPAKLFYNQELASFSAHEYTTLRSLIQKISTLTILPYEDRKLLDDCIFCEYNFSHLRELKETLEKDEFKVTEQELKLLNRIKSTSENFFAHFLIERSSESKDYLLIDKSNHRKAKQYISDNTVLKDFLNENTDYVCLPAELKSEFNDDKSLIKRDADLVSKLFDEYQGEKVFVSFIEYLGVEDRQKYYSQFSEINFLTTDDVLDYSTEFEGKFAQLMLKDKMGNELKTKILIDGKPLKKFGYNPTISIRFDDTELLATFFLDELIDDFSDEGKRIEAVRKKTSSITGMRSLLKLEDFEKEKVFDKIVAEKETDSALKITFLTAYALAQGMSDFPDIDFTNVNRIELLSLIQKYNISKFHTVLKDRFFVPANHIDADDNLTLPIEKIPDDVKKWMTKRKENYDFLLKSGLLNAQAPTIVFRRNVLEGNRCELDSYSKINRSKNYANQTLKFLHKRFKEEGFLNSTALNNITALVSEFCLKFNCLPDYLCELFAKNSENKAVYRLRKTAKIEKGKYFTSVSENSISTYLQVREEFGCSLLKFARKDIEKISPHLYEANIHKLEIEKEIPQEIQQHYREWTQETFYPKWKAEKAEGYTIHIGSTRFQTETYLIEGTEKLKIDLPDQKNIAVFDEESDTAYLQVENADDKTILSLLEEYSHELFANNSDKLTSLLLSAALEKKPEPGKDDVPQEILSAIQANPDLSAEEIAAKIALKNGISLNEKITKEQAEKIRNSIDEVNRLLEEVSREELKEILENIKSILQVLESDNDKSTPNLVIGYIGEILLLTYLEMRYPNAEIEHVAETQDLNEYDIYFKNEGIEYLIDVKTTIKSLKGMNETIAFFIKKSQYSYIQRERLDNYFISRLSLFDLQLTDFYKSLKSAKTHQEIIDKNREVIAQKAKSKIPSDF